MSILSRQRQHGAALILLVTVLILGVAWFGIGALGNAAPTDAAREIRTGLALRAAKQALLGYATAYAARTTGAGSAEPGQMPCPEFLSLVGEGQAGTSCSNATATVGRLPWRTLGIDQLRDGHGEPLWYVLSPGFRSAPMNFGTPGQLPLNGGANAAVALIIAPGRALPIGGCNTTNQQAVANRNNAPLNPTHFFECGNAAGAYVNPGSSQWNNDRVIAITAAEWADAIAPSIADRLQRQVAPALAGWHQVEAAATAKSWGTSHGFSYLPFASTWGDPTADDFCGDAGQREGLLPIVLGCGNSKWSGIATVVGLSDLGCVDMGAYLGCSFFSPLLSAPPFSVQITATAAGVAQAFRSTIVGSDITADNGGTAALSMALSGVTGNATATVDVTWPNTLVSGTTVEVRIPHLADAAVLSDSRLTWFRTNNWHQFTHYSIAAGAAAPASTPCIAGVSCLIVNGLPATSGSATDKRLALVLSGRPIGALVQPSANRANYFEADNATAGDGSFTAARVNGTFNDRIAACPFQVQPVGGPVTLCN